MNRQIACWITGLLMWLGLVQTGSCFYNSSTGRWLSRDSIAESGGPNLYNFVYNGPPNSYDILGACPPDGGGPLPCGVDKVVFEPLFWATQPGEAALWEVLLIKFTQDPSHDAASCSLVAQSKVSSVIDGVKQTQGKYGLPYDDHWHTDTIPWTKEADFYLAYSAPLKGSLYTNAKNDPAVIQLLQKFNIDPNAWDFVSADRPGIDNLKDGTEYIRKWSQRVIIFDKNSKKTVNQTDLGPGDPFSIIGNYPNLKFHPRLNK